jgi:hypothetical protein
VRCYARGGVPLVARLEQRHPPPLGQSLLVIARREAAA